MNSVLTCCLVSLIFILSKFTFYSLLRVVSVFYISSLLNSEILTLSATSTNFQRRDYDSKKQF